MKIATSISLTAMLGALALSSAGLYAADSAPDISGSYNCQYHDPLSNPPDSTEKIVFKKNGETYRVSQIGPDSVVPYASGVGLFNSNVKNAIAYLYWLPKTPTSTNVVFFKVKPDGSLDGVFAQSNRDKSGTETCTKSSSN